MLSWFLRLLARVGVRTFFRRIRVAGRDRLPARGPVLFLPNHPNGLVDPAVIMAIAPLPVHFVAKAQLFDVPVLRSLLRAAGAIPVYRANEFKDAQEANRAMFERAVEVLRAGHGLAIFPEGKSHVEPRLQELKTGAARILFAALDAGVPAPALVPVGLSFSARHLFRSDVTVIVGGAVDSADLAARRAEDEREMVRLLTDRIARAIEGQTLNLDSWEDHRLVQFAADLTRGVLVVPPPPPAADTPAGGAAPGTRSRAGFDRVRAFGDGLARLRAAAPAETDRLARRVGVFARRLDRLRLAPRHLDAAYAGGAVTVFALRNLALLLVALPFAALGTAANYLPYRVCGLVADRAGAGSLDMPATFKLYVGLLAFPLTWLVEAGVVAACAPWPYAVAAAAALPLLGYAALAFWEREDRLRSEADAWWVLRARPGLAERLRRRKAALVAEIVALAGRATAG